RLGDTAGTNYAVLSLGVGNSNNVASALEARAGTTGARFLRSLATTGTNTYSGAITLNAGLTLQSATGGIFLFQTGSIAVTTNNFFAASAASNPTATHILQDTSGDIALAATRNINVANNVTGTFDNNGNTFTINGVINGGGAIVTQGSGGSVIFTGANTYT